MNHITAFSDPLSRELCRLAELEHTALASNDIPTFLHSRLRWCELIITLCPGLSPAAPQLARRVAHLMPLPAQPIARWRLELRARPLVPIVRRRVRTLTAPSGSRYQTALEYLACGHTHHLPVVLPGDIAARRRRCRECGAARLSAIERRESTPAGICADNAKTFSVKEGGRGKLPERLRAAAIKQPSQLVVVSRPATA